MTPSSSVAETQQLQSMWFLSVLCCLISWQLHTTTVLLSHRCDRVIHKHQPVNKKTNSLVAVLVQKIHINYTLYNELCLTYLRDELSTTCRMLSFTWRQALCHIRGCDITRPLHYITRPCSLVAQLSCDVFTPAWERIARHATRPIVCRTPDKQVASKLHMVWVAYE